ncbi:putative membrane protein [Candidatus Nanobsidianus stetteri]|uniref:Putative membrane protein n=1 Tax=Nanobsidianus stetteri TaxID=1294122 RepID=R1FTF3_NANST|nr:putative membrane protein [Candidatus Nanobsidianus stetteri]
MIILLYSSYQDIKYKSVDDIIIYILLIFNVFYFLYLIIQNIYPENLIFSYFILLFFVLLYLFRLLAIGDLYIFFSIFFLLSFFSLYKMLLFLFYLVLFGFIFHNIEAIKIYRENRKKYYISIINIILILISIYFINLFILYFNIYYLLISLIFVYIPYFLFRYISKDMEEKLTFIRNVNELVEGDWIEDGIEVNNIKKEDKEILVKYFDIYENENKYILKFKRNNKLINSIIILFIIIIPLIFYFLNEIFFYYSVILIIIFYHIFQNKLFIGRFGLSKEEINILKKLGEYNDIKVKVKEGAPFIPPIFLSLILLLI